MGIPTGWELILLLGVLVLLFGSTKLPTAARSIGQSLRIFKAETKGMRSDDTGAASTVERPTTSTAERPTTSTPPQAAAQQPLPPSTSRAATPIEEPQRGSDTTR